MADTGVVLLAAFGGGLAGAVLQPVVEHTLQAVTTRGERRKRREQRLREMLEMKMQYGANLIGSCALMAMSRRLGVALPDTFRADLVERRIELGKGGFFWQPERIEDGDLRALAKAYADTCIDLEQRADSEAALSEAEFLSMNSHHSELRRALQTRMDALDWPEVD